MQNKEELELLNLTT